MDVDNILANIQIASNNISTNIVKTFADMGITSSSDVQADRLAVCTDCEQYQANISRCKECGCFMNVKTALKNSRCPLNKW